MKKINIFINKKKIYDILIKFKLFEKNKLFSKINLKNKLMIISNEYLFNTYFKKTFEELNKLNIKYNYFLVPDGESSKSLKILNEIFTILLNYSYDRNSYLIAFGGGVIGDLTGFAASIYLRGIKYIQIPTTLLSQIDSSIGGKTAINHALGKNMIGSFHNPSSVFIDINFLYTLSKRELSSGIAEIIKYAIILDYKFFVWLENNIDNLLKLKKYELTYCIYKCCKIKSKIVQKDEKDFGIRSILNFGHTYGHAIESFLGYGNWTHGEAISIGMIMASKLSYYINNFSENSLNRIRNLIYRSNLPILAPLRMKLKDYIFYMTKDKKNSNDKINVVVPLKIGKAKLIKNVSIKIIEKSINNYNK